MYVCGWSERSVFLPWSTVILVFMLIIFCHVAHEVVFNGITYENAIGLLAVLLIVTLMMTVLVTCPFCNS